jgi:hypothetical protein
MKILRIITNSNRYLRKTKINSLCCFLRQRIKEIMPLNHKVKKREIHKKTLDHKRKMNKRKKKWRKKRKESHKKRVKLLLVEVNHGAELKVAKANRASK